MAAGLDPALDKLKQEILKDLFNLKEKYLEHLEESIVATKPCMFCDPSGTAKAKDEQGRCAMCHGTNMIPDVSRRDWASEEISARIAPKPKPVEMAVTNQTKSLNAQIEAETANLSNEELDAKYQQLKELKVIG